MHAPARLPPGRHDAALPPLRDGRAARHALPGLRLAAHPLPGRRHRARRARRSACRFPQLRVGRLDRDIVERRGAAERVVDAFTDGELDVLVGTSLVTKGLDIPEVTLVGVVSADIALNLPDERAAGADLPAAGAGGRPGGPRRPAGPRHHPDLPARPSRRSGPWPTATRAAFYDAELDGGERFGVAAVRATRQADRRASRIRDCSRARGPRDGRPPARTCRGARRRRSRSRSGPAYIARRAGRWRWTTSCCAAPTRWPLLDGGPGAPWSSTSTPSRLL